MIQITGALLESLTGGRARDSFVDEIAEALNDQLPQIDVTTPLRVAHFLAQAAHESDGFRTLNEYWGPTKAQKGYEGRKDLGNVKSGDGYRYRGRGIFQLTGRANYKDIGKALGLSLEAKPDLAADPAIAVRIACKFWDDRNLNLKADADDIEGITRRINGGVNGLADRRQYLAKAKKLIGASQKATLLDPSLPPAGAPEAPGAPPVGAADTVLTPTSPKEMISALQKILTEKNYGKLNPDGDWGELTSFAVLAMQKANDLPLNGAEVSLDDAKDAKVFVSEARKDMTVEEVRATDTEAATKINKGTAVKIAGATATALPVAEKTGFLDTVSGWIDKVTGFKSALDPLAGLGAWAVEHVWFLLPIVGIAAFFLARRMQFNVLDAFKKGD